MYAHFHFISFSKSKDHNLYVAFTANHSISCVFVYSDTERVNLSINERVLRLHVKTEVFCLKISLCIFKEIRNPQITRLNCCVFERNKNFDLNSGCRIISFISIPIFLFEVMLINQIYTFVMHFMCINLWLYLLNGHSTTAFYEKREKADISLSSVTQNEFEQSDKKAAKD